MPAQLESLDGRRPPKLRAYVPAPPGRWTRREFAGYTPEDIAGVLRGLRNGEYEGTERWADLASHMLRIDAHIRATYGTLIHGVASAELEADPAPHADEGLAQAGADFVLDSLKNTPNLHGRLGDLLHAEGVGWAGLQHCWTLDRVPGEWHSTPTQINPWDLSFARDWVPTVRSYGEGNRSGYQWVRVDELHPAAVIIHVPGGIGETPNLSGDLLAVVWPWVFKHWDLLWLAESLEKNATPVRYGVVDPNAPEAVRDAMFDGLTNWSGDHSAVFEALSDGSDPIRVLDSSGNAGSAQLSAAEYYDQQISKALLGSTLNTDAATSGSRALGESQFDTTILPRLEAMSQRLTDTIEHQWARHLLRFNAHVFGGRVPPCPRLSLRLISEAEPAAPLVGIIDMLANAGAIRRNELRAIAGLEPLPVEQGGDEFVTPAQPAAAMAELADDTGADGGFHRIEHRPGGEWRVIAPDGSSVGVYRTKGEAVDALVEAEADSAADDVVELDEGTGDADDPFTRAALTGRRSVGGPTQLPLPLISRRTLSGRKTSQTSFRLPSQIANVPSD